MCRGSVLSPWRSRLGSLRVRHVLAKGVSSIPEDRGGRSTIRPNDKRWQRATPVLRANQAYGTPIETSTTDTVDKIERRKGKQKMDQTRERRGTRLIRKNARYTTSDEREKNKNSEERREREWWGFVCRRFA